MSLEMLLVIVAVVAAAVFNVVLPWLKKLQEDGLAGLAEPEVQEAPSALHATVLPASPVPGPELVTRRSAPTRPTAPVAPAAARAARRSPLGSLSGMREGIVLAAVLGPCRAQIPFV